MQTLYCTKILSRLPTPVTLWPPLTPLWLQAICIPKWLATFYQVGCNPISEGLQIQVVFASMWLPVQTL